MTDPTVYVQIADPKGNPTALYETREAGSVGWAGYLVTASVSLPATIGLTDSLSGPYNGAYIFCVDRPAILDTDPAGFAEQLSAYIKSSITANRAFFWLQSSTAPYFGTFANYGFQFGQSFNNYVVNTNMNAVLGANLIFNVQSSLVMTVDEANAQLLLSYPLTTNPLINLQTGKTIIVAATNVRMGVPVAGQSTGCAVFNASLSTATVFAGAPKGLQLGLQYAYYDGAQDQTLFFPVFALGAMPATLAAQLVVDPSDPINIVVGGAALAAGYLRSGMLLSGAPALPSAYVNQQGNALTLTPVGANVDNVTPPARAGGFAFASLSPLASTAASRNLYLTPTGTSQVATASVAAGAQIGLLGGLFGSEAVVFPSYSSSAEQNCLLCFVPSQAAYAPTFPFAPASLQQSGSGTLQPRLTDAYQTAWATLLPSGGAPTVYQAQPEGSPLYGVTAAQQNDVPPILGSTPPFLPFTGSTAAPFPLIAYSLTPTTSASAKTLTDYESQIVAPTRKQIISSQASATNLARSAVRKARHLGAKDASLQYSTSPQGFLVTSDPATGAYLNVLLGQSSNGAGGYLPFSFAQPVSDALESALQTNQLFLVAVNPVNLGTFNSTSEIAGWTFSAQVGHGVSPSSYANVLILKFCSGSLVERVTNPNQWTAPQDFSLAPDTAESTASIAYAGLAQWLQAYLADAIAKAQPAQPSARFYENFATLVQDPNWNGVLVLNADLSVSDLPPEIAGLAAGIDFSRFAAHHFGFTVSRVLADPTATPPLHMDGESSFFGLIDYEQPAYQQNIDNNVDPNVPVAVPVSGDFQFTVLLLQALFENTRLADFESRVQLSVATLFGSTVTQTVSNAVPGVSDGAKMPGNAVVLVGSYVAQSGDDSSAGSYVFQQTQTTVFQLNSNVLQAVAFDHVQFNTLSSDADTTVSRFIVWGDLDFVTLDATDGTGFDVLSFGSAAGTPALQLGAGLSFSNFTITLSSPNATPNVQTFAVSTSNLNYDLSSSTARENGLFKGFGLQLKSFITAGPNEMPANYGFLPVTSPLNLTTLSYPWQGVVYRVTMGGPGALASAAGFDSDLLLAWASSGTAGSTQTPVFVGLSLPGASPGAKLFSLQGVFKVAVGSISLIRQQIAGSERYGYCLRLDDIAVKILGIAKLPPDATIQFFLFGDPDNTGSLGWYAAWVANDSATQFTAKLAAPESRLLPVSGDRP
ncbi:hypothetical protein [Paraburkholderia phenazinium]|uniref:Uncharacterized protein n=1 Tax=Paraburkholderia phenazinium TaxID=60549 RepID=A0A1G7W951_9BURK|nr:hypothetical protein [Paraburkholderia phenazinium]SDG68504.1 hypothetical protein SAMN05216466_104458 [Paraburkholderia phenazinium]